MKNNELKSLAKSARKSAAADIESTILAALKNVAAKLGQDAKHFTKEIEKGAAKLAKKLSKEMDFDKSAKLEAGDTIKVTGPPKTSQSTAKNGKTINGAEKSLSVAKAEVKPAAAETSLIAKKTQPKASQAKAATKPTQPKASTPTKKPASKKIKPALKGK
jgi:hypothetical protein